MKEWRGFYWTEQPITIEAHYQISQSQCKASSCAAGAKREKRVQARQHCNYRLQESK